MSPRPAVLVLTDAVHALAEGTDPHDVLLHILDACVEVLGGRAAGAMVSPENGRLELLAATSHRSTELELFQIQSADGPCLDVIRTGEIVVATGEEELHERWAETGRAIVEAGYRSVRAFPMRHHDVVFGGLNVFGATLDSPPDEDALAVGQAFADLVTVLLLAPPGQAARVEEQLRAAIAGRAVIEQAKGVLAYSLHVDMARAYDVLLERARTSGTTVTEEAERTVDAAQDPRTRG